MADVAQLLRKLLRDETESKGSGFTSLAKLPDISFPNPVYPTVHLDKDIAGLDKVGKKVKLVVQARVNAIAKTEGQEPCITLDLLSIKNEGEISGFEDADKPVYLKRTKGNANSNLMEGEEGFEAEA